MSSPTRTRLIVAALVVAATMVLAYTVARPADPVSREARRAAPAVPVVDVATVAAAPRLLFRHAAIDANYNHLSLAPLDAPNAPDNRGIAYKKRVGSGLAPWRFYALELETMIERPIAAETRSIDDQLEWLDDTHVLNGVHRSSQSAMMDVWVAPIGPGEAAQPFLSDAESPVIVR